MLDRRIRDVLRLIESKRYRLLSLDIFDTLAWRMVPSPPDVFFLVAQRLRGRGWMHDSSSAESFVKERIAAEEAARRRQASHEVTLAEIYEEFPRGYLRGAAPQQVMEVELATEREVVRVNPDMRALLEAAKQKGLATALVSDTYFDSRQIAELIDVTADYMLLSCEQRLSKSRGLHGKLTELSSVPPKRILHVGNDYVADVIGPGNLKVERYWFRILPDDYGALFHLELPGTLSERAQYFLGSDSGLSALRSRCMFRSDDEYERWGLGVLGPPVSGFCDWVASQCASGGIELALCLMREGRILKQVLDLTGVRLRTAELFVSRFAARKAAILQGTQEELRAFLLRPSPLGRAHMLAQLGLETDGVDPAEVLTPEQTMKLIRQVRADPALRRRVIRDSERVRAGLVAHLKQAAGGALPARVAIVDLGYRGTIQECLQRVLQAEGLGVETHGYYFVTGGEVRETQATGAVAEGWLAENGQPVAMAHTFMRSPEIVEQCLMADCGTALGYGPGGEPILDEWRIPEQQRAQIASVQRGIRAFAEAWRQHRAEEGLADTAHLKELYRAICIRSVARPLDVELDLFGGWRHDENFGSQSSRGLAAVEGLGAWELSHISPHQLASLPMSQVHWPFGLARRISPVMGEAVRHLFLRTVEPGVFESADDPHVMVIYWDTGSGFRKEESMICRYALSNRGRVWRRFTMNKWQERARALAFQIGLPGQVVQLTGIILRGKTAAGERTFARLGHEEIQKLGYHHLSGNLYRVEEDPALLLVPVQGIPEDASPVSVDLFFGIVAEAEGGRAITALAG
jgi:FMN phosphatase YigB (HAD superfamily)